jgi:uncharacterized protein YjbI with pentapeptide repeats
MANPEHLAKLREGANAWNAWRDQNPGEKIDLSRAVFESAEWIGIDLGQYNLRGANLREAKLRVSRENRANLVGALLRDADLSGAELRRADLMNANLRDAVLAGAELNDANLSDAMLEKADLHGADLFRANASGAHLSKANLESANLKEANLVGADLSEAKLWKANLSHAQLGSANLRWTDLRDAYAVSADLSGANLNSANLRFANLSRANLRGADLRAAHADYADLREADLTGAALFRTGLNTADLSKATLTGADLRAATLLQAKLNEAILNDAMLWETQRGGWIIEGIVCKRAFWDKNAKDPTTYEPGEFERLHSDQACIELFYQGGVSKFELNTLPALLHHLASLHQGANIRLKSIEETGGGAKISISVGDSDPETVEKIRTDAVQVYQAQLALRDNEILRLDTEKKYLESFVSERLIKAMLTATTPQNVFNAPVYGAAFPSGNAKVELHQTINDNSGILELLERIMERREDLTAGGANPNLLEAEVQSAKAELEKADPSPTILSRSLKFVQTVASEAVSKAAAKLGEQAVSADWPSLLHQLNQFVAHLK